VRDAFVHAIERESSDAAKRGLEATLRSMYMSAERENPLCVDTGWPIFYFKVGNRCELEGGFVEFLSNPNLNQLKGEYLLPSVVGELVESGKASVKVLPTNDKWFGVTYGEDKYAVKEEFLKLQANGTYPKTLY
jgi:tartrate dehydratase alpha subunit/fumarate hydratase class I-like protein